MFNVIEALEDKGHRIIPFSVRYEKNRQSPYEKYFVAPLSDPREVYFKDQNKSLRSLTKTAKRLFYASDVEKAVRKIVDETQPQVAYVLHYLRKLSPSLLVGLKRSGVPIVVRLSDYAMLCPQAHCLRDEITCDLCCTGSLASSVKYRCVQNSFAASALNALATWYHRFKKYFELIDKFVVTNQFMFEKMINAGFEQNKLVLIPSFVKGTVFRPVPNYSKKDYIVYSGRIERIKGVHILIDAFQEFCKINPDRGIVLKIAGEGPIDYLNFLQKKLTIPNNRKKIEFLGNLDSSELSNLLSNALFSVVPSLWYENLPNTLLESFACGTPVLASDIGSLTDCIKIGKTGYLFKTNDHFDLLEKMILLLRDKENLKTMSINARIEAEVRFSKKAHIDSLENLFDGLLKKTKFQM